MRGFIISAVLIMLLTLLIPIYGCEGCEYNFECALAWMNRGIREDKIDARYPTHIRVEINSWEVDSIEEEIAQAPLVS